MKRRLSDGSGFLEIDHKDSPGLTEADVAHLPAHVRQQFLIVRGGQVEARDIMQCSHCERGVVLEPKRVRARAVCPKCYKFICDSCEAVRARTGVCVPFKQVLDRAASIAEQFATDPTHPDAVMDIAALSTPSAPTVAVPASATGKPADRSIVLTDA